MLATNMCFLLLANSGDCRKAIIKKALNLTCSAAKPTRAASGLPPYVLPCSPRPIVSMISSRASTADTGYMPPLSALPRMRMSALMPSQSWHISLPAGTVITRARD